MIFQYSVQAILRRTYFPTSQGNIDHNARSTTATQHYHGTSMTVMQFLSTSYKGETHPRMILNNDKVYRSKKVLPIPSSYVQPKPFHLKKNVFCSCIMY